MQVSGQPLDKSFKKLHRCPVQAKVAKSRIRLRVILRVQI
jgi:hypothetical protein